MKIKNKIGTHMGLKSFILAFSALILILLSISFISAQIFSGSNTYSRSFTAYSPTYVPYSGDPGFPLFDRSMCEAGQDFILQVDPLGCEPSVVRSDILEDQNVPVFCPIVATQLNPMIDIKAISTITFSFAGPKPKEVVGVTYVPARAALGRFRAHLNQPVLNNIGYAVIVLRRQPNESALTNCMDSKFLGLDVGEVCVVGGNLTARIRYDIQNAFGVGRSVYYLPETTEDEWEENFLRYSFWDGRGYLRAEGIDNQGATISVYSDRETYGSGKSDVKRKLATFNLNVGESSRNIPLPGFDYCFGYMDVKLNGLESPDTRVNLKVNGNILELKEGEKFIDNKCTIKYIENHGINERVIISCKGDTERGSFQIGIKPKLKINLGGTEKEVSVGQKLYEIDNEKSAYLVYAGTKTNIVSESDLFIVIMSAPGFRKNLEEAQIRSIGRLLKNFKPSETPEGNIVDAVVKSGRYAVGAIEKSLRKVVKGQSFKFVSFGESKDIFGKSVAISGFADATDSDLSSVSTIDKNFQSYYFSGTEDYDYILEGFSQEKSLKSDKTLGQEALSGKINLALSADQKRTALELCNEFKARYPSQQELSCEKVHKFSSPESSFESVVINGRVYNIVFDSIREPSFDEFGATISIMDPSGNIEPVDFRKNTLVYLNETTNEYIQLLDLQKGELDRGATARIKVNLRKSTTLKEVTSFFTESSTKVLSYGITETFGSRYQFTLEKVNLEKIAKVSINPKINYARTNATFKFKIGIEKRGIQLSPEKTRERIESLNKTLEKWQEINRKLGTVISGFKAACLGVGAGLTVKNFFLNLGGKGIARQEVMRSDGGWFDFCKSKESLEIYGSVDACLLKNSDEINRDVNIVSEVIKNQEVITNENAADRLSQIRESLGDSITNPDNAEEIIDISESSDVGSAFSAEGFSERKITPSQAKDLDRLQGVLSTPGIGEELKKLSEKKRYSILLDIKANTQYFSERVTLVNSYGISSDQIVFLQTSEDVKAIPYTGLTYEDIQSKTQISGIDETTPIALLPSDTGQTYIVVLDDTIGINTFPIKKDEDNQPLIYNQKDGTLVSEPPSVLENAFFERVDRTTYENRFVNPEVRYYESGTYAGFPAIVPFDLQDGWYAYIKPTMPIWGAIRAYDASGVVRSFYICNVGRNGRAEFNSGIGDDKCSGFAWMGQPPVFSGLDEGKARTLKNTAERAISDAQRQYRSGVSKVIIERQEIKVGPPEIGVPDIQCQDFMSPKDCNLLFNVCDPVVCPSSRCDLGGAYPVKDVVQSGIAGSIALCLPNGIYWGGDVYVPICLSGVHAGIEGLLTIFDSYQQCLQTSLDTGQTVGVCDEINSIYLCDFFWRQSIPLAKIAITKGLGTVLGQNVRGGGGEYLGVQDAWQRADDSVDFFTQQYAANSFKAFKLRSMEDVGTAVCKNFISIAGPSGGNFFDALTTPDSPVQFYGRFDEIPFTTATNPPISQYKVFYHIYAGKDFPAYYQVYLRGTGGSFYQDASFRRIVAQGFIKAGDYFTETRDLTAPSGYQQMCIIVNGQEECGFKQVTTEFGINYITEQYVASQASQADITSETACVSGTPSVFSLLSPNIQAGATEGINPALYNRGITRICATDNPGLGTDSFANTENGRWQPVGYCGNTKIQCWLDTNSVKTTIKNTNIEDKILDEVTPNYMEALEREGGFLSNTDFNELVNDVKKESNNFRKINMINANIDKVFIPTQRAFLILLRADTYTGIVLDIYSRYLASLQEEPTPPPTDDEDVIIDDEEAVRALEEFERALETGTISPIFEYKYGGFLGIAKKSIYYAYSGNNWYFSFKGEQRTEAWFPTDKDIPGVWTITPRGIVGHPYEGLSEEMQEFTIKFVGKSYSEGLRLLISRTANNNVELSTDSVKLSKGRFKVMQQEASDLYFEYNLEQKRWKWSPDRKNWMHVPITVVSGGTWDGKRPAQVNIDLIELLEEKNYFDGARIIFGIDALAFQEISEEEPEEEICSTEEDCQKYLGERIVELAKAKKETVIDVDIKADTGAESFGCLVLQIAYTESRIRHCKQYMDSEGNPLYCEGNRAELITGDEFNSLGIMQINIQAHPNVDVADFEENVNYGIDLLINGYSLTSKEYVCNGKTYRGWARALRGYNGWNIDCSKGNVNYVENVIFYKGEIEDLFPEVCGS